MNPNTEKTTRKLAKQEARRANRDPLTKTPGAHPVGVGIGAAVGGATGVASSIAATVATASASTVLGGPVGGAIGLAAGAAIGAAAGKGVAEQIDPTEEDSYWRAAYTSEPYYESPYNYADYGPAYRTGYQAANRYAGKTYDEIEDDLQVDYARNRGQSRLGWEKAKHAVQSAWHRLTRSQERAGEVH